MGLEHGCDNRHRSEGGIQIWDDLTYICYPIKTNKEKGKFQLNKTLESDHRTEVAKWSKKE